MASTYTTNLRLTKQGDGDNPNSWGEVLNQQVISLVDDAIAGYTTIDIGASFCCIRISRISRWKPFKYICTNT